jgi:hypothetical protein
MRELSLFSTKNYRPRNDLFLKNTAGRYPTWGDHFLVRRGG